MPGHMPIKLLFYSTLSLTVCLKKFLSIKVIDARFMRYMT
jgi:hypothetical protein